jgi:hypothetical protein
MRRFAKSIAAWLRSSGTSRMEGLTIATPPHFEIIRAISSARRLSKAATRNPANVAMSMGTGRKSSGENEHDLMKT